MDFWPPHVYRKEAKQHTDPETAKVALGRASKVQRSGFPPIVSLGHLAWHVEVSYDHLRAIVGRRTDPYRVFTIRKKGGTQTRFICAPEPRLLKTQKWLHTHVFSKCKTHPASYAYKPGASVVSCAQMHCGCRWLVKLDVQRFFESISEIRVFRVLRSLGYGQLVAFELARLTTRILDHNRPRYRFEKWQNLNPEEYRISYYADRRIGHLPQGAPTSPMLSNLAVQGLDDILEEIADSHGAVYTRYSDDLVFSTADEGFSRQRASALIQSAYSAIMEFGLRPQTSKTTVVPPGARKVVLGLLVDQKRPRLPRDFRKRLECHLYYINRWGPVAHAQRRGFETVWGLKRHIEGLISYAVSVEPEFGGWAKSEFDRADWPL